jgi:predicted transcriptional regulator
MFAQDILSNDVPVLHLKMSAQQALQLMGEWHAPALPVIDGLNYLGVLREDQVLGLGLNDPIQWITNSLDRPVIHPEDHILEMLPLFVKYKVPILAVLNSQEHYLGVVRAWSVMEALHTFLNTDKSGTTVVLEMSRFDYQLSQLAQMAEEANINIVASSVVYQPDSTRATVTLRLNTLEADRLISTFARYNYLVVGTYTPGQTSNDLHDNYTALLHYLDI